MIANQEGALKLIRFMFEVKKRPSLFLSKKSITELEYVQIGFVLGYNNALDYNIDDYAYSIKKGNIWISFCDYLSDKYDISGSNYRHLLSLSYSEADAFDLFFDELEAYLNANGIEIPEIK